MGLGSVSRNSKETRRNKRTSDCTWHETSQRGTRDGALLNYTSDFKGGVKEAGLGCFGR